MKLRGLLGLWMGLAAGCSSTPPSGSSPQTATTPAPGNSTAGLGGAAPVAAASTSASGGSGMSTSGVSGAPGPQAQATAAVGGSSSAGTSGTVAASMVSRDVGNFFESGAWHGYVFVSADGNPAISYKEVACPEELAGKGVRRSGGAGGRCLN